MKIEDGQDSFTQPAHLAWCTAGSTRKTKRIGRFKCKMASAPSQHTAVFNSYFLFSQQSLCSRIIVLVSCSCSIFMLYEVCCHQSLVPLSRPDGRATNTPLGTL